MREGSPSHEGWLQKIKKSMGKEIAGVVAGLSLMGAENARANDFDHHKEDLTELDKSFDSNQQISEAVDQIVGVMEDQGRSQQIRSVFEKSIEGVTDKAKQLDIIAYLKRMILERASQEKLEAVRKKINEGVKTNSSGPVETRTRIAASESELFQNFFESASVPNKASTWPNTTLWRNQLGMQLRQLAVLEKRFDEMSSDESVRSAIIRSVNIITEMTDQKDPNKVFKKAFLEKIGMK